MPDFRASVKANKGLLLYLSTRPNYDWIDNALKYSYVLMKGEASPERISELEDLFEINRDNTKIRQINRAIVPK